jgi:hypothetical protein
MSYKKVHYACIDAPGFTKKTADGHTVGSYSYGNGPGAIWGAELRPKTCEKCGKRIVTGVSWPVVQEYQGYEKILERLNDYYDLRDNPR